MKTVAFWEVTPCSLMDVYPISNERAASNFSVDGGYTFLINDAKYCGNVDPFLGNARKRNSFTTPLLSNGFANKYVSTAITERCFLCGLCRDIISRTDSVELN
jgi:hypothetical protein